MLCLYGKRPVVGHRTKGASDGGGREVAVHKLRHGSQRQLISRCVSKLLRLLHQPLAQLCRPVRNVPPQKCSVAYGTHLTEGDLEKYSHYIVSPGQPILFQIVDNPLYLSIGERPDGTEVDERRLTTEAIWDIIQF